MFLNKVYFSLFMNLNEKIGNILADISEHVYDIKRYGNRKYKLLNYMLKKGLIDDFDIEYSVEAGILGQARKYYDWIINRSYYPDHVPYPEFLVYAIENDEFTDNEISIIKFDHNEDKDEFCRLYGRTNLVGELFDKLFNEGESYMHNSNTDWCFDGPCTV
jgi:hypothetical protein